MDFSVLIILNNFFHDLAAAMWFCGTIVLYYIVQKSKGLPKDEDTERYITSLFQVMRRVTNISLGFVCGGGVIRALNYMEYEWMDAMGREQITLLVIKHILLAFIVVAGIVLQYRLSQDMKIFKQKQAICETD
jgi:putative copper export protein